MKIEIAENLVYSYLKHIEGCRIVQTNWKTSGEWNITDYDTEIARDLFLKINKSEVFNGIFKNNNFDQLIKQAEIDVLGINTTEESIFGIDVAFHTAGLNYGSKEETAQKIILKLIRTIFIMQSYFKTSTKFNSIFVTPKVNPAVEKEILVLLDKIKSIISDEMITISFIANEEFYSKIVDPLIIGISNENDTSELFSRAVKLLDLDKRKKKEVKHIHKSVTTITTNKRTIEGMKIGQYVQFMMRKLYEQNKITEAEIMNLQDKDYSKDIFDQNYEILRSIDKSITGNDNRNRYYVKELFCGNYYLNSQWVERHWDRFLDWISYL